MKSILFLSIKSLIFETVPWEYSHPPPFREDAAKDIALDTRVELAFPQLFLPKQNREGW